MSLQRACSLADIPADTGVLGVEVDGEPVVIVRDGDGVLHAINNICSHQYVLLSEGEVEDGEIECWLHGSRFDLSTGEAVNLPATAPVDVYDVRVEGDDVLVDVTSRPAPDGGHQTLSPTANANKEN